MIQCADLIVIATRRSGHHAYIDWLCRRESASGRIALHLNDPNMEGVAAHQIYYHDGEILPPVVEAGRPDFIVANLEDFDLREPMPIRAEKSILFVRDGYNCLASQRKRGWLPGYRTWIQHAREAAGESRLIPGVETVLFNYWRDETKYQPVPTHLSRSSFPESERGNLDERWRAMSDDPLYRHHVLKNPEIRRLCQTLFPGVVDTGVTA